MNPSALNIKGSTQPEIFRATVDAMAQALAADAAKFWQESASKDGPLEIWEINGERCLYNGNHRYHAAAQAGADIFEFAVVIVDRTGSSIPTFPLDQLTWLPGFQ